MSVAPGFDGLAALVMPPGGPCSLTETAPLATWTTVIGRKITGPHGEFFGAIGRGIEPAHFEKFFASLALGDDAAISMVHRDGTLLARYPHNDSMIGRNFSIMS